jgi:hypothetical protein
VGRSTAVIGGLALAVVLIVAGSLGLRAARGQLAADRAAGAPQTLPSGDEAKYHELAERLLSFGYGPTGPTSILLLPGALPTDPQVTLPNVNGARLVGSAVRVRGTDRSADVVLDAPGDPQQVAAAYEQGFKDLGWSGPPAGIGPSTAGGFQVSVPPVSKFLCKGDGAFVSISVTARPGLPDDVRISVQPNMAAYGGGGPCSAQARGPSAGGSNHLPVLRPPDGATLIGGGGGMSSSIGGSGSINRQSSESSATSSMTAGELEAAFAKQLAAAGWTRLAGRDDGALAWSTWTSTESGWSGSLIVNDTSTKDRRSLLLRAEGPG